MQTDNEHGYSTCTKALHWSSALLTLSLFGLGIWMVGVDYYDDWYYRAPSLHISLGLLLFFLTCLRLGWRLFNPAMPSPAAHARWMKLTAKWVKRLLYVLLLTLLISGYFITTAKGKSASFFDLLHLPATLQLTGTQVDAVGGLHHWGAWLLMALVSLHASAALFHHWISKDNTLTRMLPFASETLRNHKD